jgi:hypothetical protein
MLLWALYSLVHGLFYEIELSLIFVHPKSFRESQHWSATFGRILLKNASGIVLIGYSVLFIQIVYPALLDQFIFGLLYFTPKSLLVDLFGSVIMMSVGLIIFSFLLQTTFLRRKEA